MTISFHLNISATIAATSTAVANFGQALVAAEHSITANRQDGPYTSLSGLEAAGFTAAAAPAVYNSAARIFGQLPRTQSIMVGRRASGEALPTALSAIEAVNPAGWYLTLNPVNTPNEILALAAWTETRTKIALAQTSSAAMLAGTASEAQVSTLTIGGTAADGDYSIQVIDAWSSTVIGTATVTRAGGSPATNDDIATSMRSAWDAVAALAGISAAAAGTGADVEITFDGLGNGYTFVLTAPGGASITENTPSFVQDPGALGAALGYNRTALIYHDDDTEYLDAALASRCLGFNLDAPAGAGTWAYHNPVGVTPTALTVAEKTRLLGLPVNYYSPITYTSGLQDAGRTFPGKMLGGRFIDEITSMDLTKSRLEEALLAVPIRAASTSRPKVPFTDEGAALFKGAGMNVLRKLVNAGHWRDGAVSEATGRITPYIDVPRVSSLSAAQLASRTITMSGEAVYQGAIHSVGDANTVGFTIDLSF